MRYLLILVLVLAVTQMAAAQEHTQTDLASLSVSELVAKGMLDGRTAAKDQSTGGRFIGGFVAGVGLGLIGAGIAYAAASSTPEVPAHHLLAIQDNEATYQAAFQEAYRNDIRSRRRSNAAIGGLLGTAVIVSVIVATAN